MVQFILNITLLVSTVNWFVPGWCGRCGFIVKVENTYSEYDLIMTDAGSCISEKENTVEKCIVSAENSLSKALR